MPELKRFIADPVAARREARKQLRESIQGRHLLLSIEDIVKRLTSGVELTVDPPPGVDPDTVSLSNDRISALRAALDAHFKLLNKVLPDLKAVELTGADGGPLQVEEQERSATEVAARLVWLLRTQGETIDVDTEESEHDFLD